METKEISEELEERRSAVCLSCGAIFEGIKSIFEPCPECGKTYTGLRWITTNHNWMSAVSETVGGRRPNRIGEEG